MSKGFMWQKQLEDWCAFYNDTELGYLEYYKPWKKWVWNQNEDIIMSIKCMENVCKKLKILGDKKKNG